VVYRTIKEGVESEMPKVPKIVRERLQAPGAAADSHPDPDVLTSFAEQSLATRERAAVLEHLSRCGECREVLALALPATEPVQAGAHRATGSWGSWPAIRWAFASAGLVAIALFGFVQYGHHSEAVRMAKNAPPAATVQAGKENERGAEGRSEDQFKAKTDQSSQIAAAAPGGSGMLDMDRREPGSAPAHAEVAKNYSSPAVRGTLAHGPRQTGQWQQQNSNVLQAPNAPRPSPETKQIVSLPDSNTRVPAAREMVQVQSVPEAGPTSSAGAVIAGNAPQPLREAGSDTGVSRAKTASETPSALSKTEQTSMPMQGRSYQALAGTVPIWTITSGRLQRSFDRGSSWQDVDVFSGGGTSLELAVASRKSRKDSSKAENKEAIVRVFRTVAANGVDVWAGGEGAMLYHSQDAGAHWTQVIPSADTVTLTGDVVRLEFPDAQRGKVSTSTGEVWTTTDSGQTWRKQ